ncbi:hypothetical protein [Halalkalibacter akibai]|uniref:Chemotaxis methyl-accepting receptor HlyB-like 4HB MCP domain-containing protein n=1 Tax=Halalkalibacter akibai (strain ATCC 43226 / DSM 21942 / CIP 109018 / JCM 9157 / 1139) TaxID=1236973 RepID=W4QVY7_HALA3|nr:hypothetical protein [Halalkalibacter akibai]GAE35469.1 hypothetical protein JCM9157_2577 [Halalkalibacter akibai JCM 9157]
MKIPGFRSGKGWKMGLATLGYGLALLFIASMVFGPFTEEAADVNRLGIQATNNQLPSIEVLEVQDGIVDAYLAEIDQITYYMNLSLGRLEGHIANLEGNPNWIEEARDENNTILQFAGQLQDFENVPKRFEAAHASFIEGSNAVEQFHALFAEALDRLETGDTDRVRALISEAMPFMSHAQTLLYQGYSMT